MVLIASVPGLCILFTFMIHSLKALSLIKKSLCVLGHRRTYMYSVQMVSRFYIRNSTNRFAETPIGHICSCVKILIEHKCIY